MKQRIKILVADNHPLIRHVIKEKLEFEDDMVVVAEATDGTEAVNLAREVSPDVVLMDIDMPKKDGITATREIMNGSNTPRIIGFSASRDKSTCNKLLEAGAVAFLSKKDIKVISNTIRRKLLMSSGSRSTKLEKKRNNISEDFSNEEKGNDCRFF